MVPKITQAWIAVNQWSVKSEQSFVGQSATGQWLLAKVNSYRPATEAGSKKG